MRAGYLFNGSAAFEMLTGTALLVAPSLVIELLFGSALDQTGTAVARVLGIAFLSLGASCWELSPMPTNVAPRFGLSFYNIAAAVFLMLCGTIGGQGGPLLWPASGLHMLIGAGMFSILLKQCRNRT